MDLKILHPLFAFLFPTWSTPRSPEGALFISSNKFGEVGSRKIYFKNLRPGDVDGLAGRRNVFGVELSCRIEMSSGNRGTSVAEAPVPLQSLENWWSL